MNIREALKIYNEQKDALQEIENQIKDLLAQKRELESQMEEIELGLRDEMLNSGTRRAIIAGWRLNISTAVSTIVEETDTLPERFWRIEKKPDLLKIREALKSGEEVEGARMIKKESLSLKKVS